MNRHQNAAKKYLSQAFGLNQRIESKLKQIDELHYLASKATVTYSDMPRNPNKGHSKVEETVIKIMELEEEIKLLKAKTEAIKSEQERNELYSQVIDAIRTYTPHGADEY